MYRVRCWIAARIYPSMFVRGTFATVRRRLARWVEGSDLTYCDRCSACGEPPCCPPTMCDGGFGCAGAYGDARQREQAVKDWENEAPKESMP
jgi:hypothetical protein